MRARRASQVPTTPAACRWKGRASSSATLNSSGTGLSTSAPSVDASDAGVSP